MDTGKSQTNLVGLVHTQFWFLCASYLPSPPTHSGWVLLFFQVLCSCFVLPVAAWACRALQREIFAGVAVIPASDALILRDTKWVMKMQVLFKHLSFVHSSDRPQMGWSLCNCSPASCAVHKSWALTLFIDFVYTSPLSTHLALSYFQKTVQVTYCSPKGTWDPMLGPMSANRMVELGGWGWVGLWVCQWVAVGAGRAVLQCHLFSLKSVASKGWSAALTDPLMLDGFVPTTPLHFGQNVHPRGQKECLNLNRNTTWKHLWASWDSAGCLPQPPRSQDLAVLLTALGSLLCAISMHRPAECSVFQKSGGPSLGTADSRVL